MTREEAISIMKVIVHMLEEKYDTDRVEEAVDMAIKALEQEPCEDAISRQAAIKAITNTSGIRGDALKALYDLPSVNPQEPKTDKYEHHIDHTDCIWYGSDSGCPVTCSQYRDGWNDAMDYIFKNGKGYRPYRHDGWATGK